jgi:hypothetical protein
MDMSVVAIPALAGRGRSESNSSGQDSKVI